jgi:Cu(I)/Ag(I) efflux system membrane fusion protein
MFLKFDLTLLTLVVFTMSIFGCKSIEEINFTAKGCCPTCEELIKEAVACDGVKSVSWDQYNEILTVEIFTGSTTSSELQKLVSLAGYDTDMYLAPDSVYFAMPACCRYRD